MILALPVHQEPPMLGSSWPFLGILMLCFAYAAEDVANMPQHRANMAQHRPKMSPTWAQLGPKLGPSWAKMAPKSIKNRLKK